MISRPVAPSMRRVDQLHRRSLLGRVGRRRRCRPPVLPRSGTSSRPASSRFAPPILLISCAWFGCTRVTSSDATTSGRLASAAVSFSRSSTARAASRTRDRVAPVQLERPVLPLHHLQPRPHVARSSPPRSPARTPRSPAPPPRTAARIPPPAGRPGRSARRTPPTAAAWRRSRRRRGGRPPLPGRIHDRDHRRVGRDAARLLGLARGRRPCATSTMSPSPAPTRSTATSSAAAVHRRHRQQAEAASARPPSASPPCFP